MTGKKKAAVRLSCVLCLCILLLTGCGEVAIPETVSAPTIAISEDGLVTQYLVDNFDEDYYDITELREMVTEEVNKFNAAQKTESAPITVQSVENATDGSNKVIVKLQYNNADSYQKYNESQLFYGTIAQAHEAGYELDITMTSVKDGSAIGKAEINDMGSKHVIIAEAGYRMAGSKKPLYISEGLSVGEDGFVDTAQAEGLVYIIIK